MSLYQLTEATDPLAQNEFAGATVRVAGPDSLAKTRSYQFFVHGVDQILFPWTPTAASPANRLLWFPESP